VERGRLHRRTRITRHWFFLHYVHCAFIQVLLGCNVAMAMRGGSRRIDVAVEAETITDKDGAVLGRSFTATH
jgi:hypothetical protein